MCGICGIVNFRKDNPPSTEVLNRMNQTLTHRGPDDEGVYLDKRAGLAVKRLSIIDLTTGHQPLHNEGESIWLILNGEIYNYKELRIELEHQGHHFYTNSDAETVIHVYEQYGESSVSKLRGMFAFALWDERNQTLLLARDRLGIKPLYYSVLSDKIIFASETKSLFQCDALKAELNLTSIDQFFSFTYVPGPYTIYKNVRKLSPGHILLLKDNKLQIKEYWRLDYTKRFKHSEEECVDRLSELLEESIKFHLRSDVPIGIFLSGGIDSSTITYLVNQKGVKPIKTFSIGFDDEKFNELSYARLVANRFRTEHYEESITDRAIDSLPTIVKQLNEPLADVSIIPTYFISRMAHQKVKVVLSGEGGDELFAGYDWYKISSLRECYQWLPVRARQYLADIARGREIKILEERSRFYRRLRNFLLYRALPPSGRYRSRVACFTDEQKQKLFSEDFKRLLRKAESGNDNYPFGEKQKIGDFLTAMLYFDMKLYLPDDLLAKMDQMTMAYSLEGRVPFLDHKLVEFAISLPPKMKLHNNISKYILRKIISSKVPKEILTKSKQGFVPPIQRWMDKRLSNFFMPILDDKKTKERGYFNQSFIKQMLERQKKGQGDYSYQIWALVAFEFWLRAHLDK